MSANPNKDADRRALKRAIAAGGPGGATGPFDTADIVDGAITEPKLADGAVTSSKLAANAVLAAAIAAGAIGTTAIADASITAAKLAPGAVQAAPQATVAGPRRQIFCVWGQSNGVGATHVAGSAYQGDPDELGEENPLGGLFEVSRGKTTTPRYSPPVGQLRKLEYRHAGQNNDSGCLSFHFAKEYKRLNPGLERLVISNRSVGATGFADNDWNPGDTTYELAFDELEDFLNTEEGQQYEFMGVLFVFGENDANDGQTTAFYKTRARAMWDDVKTRLGERAKNAVLIHTTMVPEWRAISSGSGNSVSPAMKAAIHQAQLELGDEESDMITVNLDDATIPETVDLIHWGLTNTRLGGRFIGLSVTQALYGLSRSTDLPEYRFEFNGTSFENSIDGSGLIHDQRIVEDADGVAWLDTADVAGGSTYTTGYETEITLNHRAYTIAMWVRPQVEIPASNTVTFAISGVNSGTLVFMGYGACRHGAYGAGVMNWVGQLAVGTPAHLALTFDGTSLRAYLNGAERLNSPQTTNAAVIPGLGDLRLGYFEGLAASYLKAHIREVVVLPYAISTAGVASLAAQ